MTQLHPAFDSIPNPVQRVKDDILGILERRLEIDYLTVEPLLVDLVKDSVMSLLNSAEQRSICVIGSPIYSFMISVYVELLTCSSQVYLEAAYEQIAMWPQDIHGHYEKLQDYSDDELLLTLRTRQEIVADKAEMMRLLDRAPAYIVILIAAASSSSIVQMIGRHRTQGKNK